MAKLSAHGTELKRFERTDTTQHSRGPESSRSTLALMSDGATLEKRDVTFNDAFGGKRTVSSGWKILGRNAQVKDPNVLERITVYFTLKGYKEITK